MKSRSILKSSLLVLTFMLLIFPFILTFNDVLTQFVLKFQVYKYFEDKIVPIEVQLIGLVVRLFDVDFIPLKDGMIANGFQLKLIWSCLGWQSLLLFVGSALIGLTDKSYTFFSKFEAVILGLFGIFWMNILRMSLIVLLSAYSKALFAWIYHDYLAAVVTILFLFLFWWFAYSFILAHKYLDLS